MQAAGTRAMPSMLTAFRWCSAGRLPPKWCAPFQLTPACFCDLCYDQPQPFL